MKHIKGYKVFESNTDDYYKEITIDYIIDNIPKDRFIDIDKGVVNFVKNNISKYIMDHTPRSKIYADNHKGSGIYTENSITNLTISGFDYNINLKNKWLRTFRIFSLTDDYYIACFYMIGYSMYFLCDQFDGLVKLLVDYKICDEPVNEGNIFKEEDYYTEMLYDDACEMVHLKNRIAFSDKEVNILKDISDKKGYKYSIQDRDRGTTTIEGSCINFYKEIQKLKS